MANYTKNLNLKKPLQTEFYDVDDFNGNADIIDEKMGEAIDHHKDYSNPHKTTADGVKAPKMLTYGETKNFATVLDACNALKYGGGFVASNYTEMVNASDYPKKGYEFVFHVVCEANEARKVVIAYMYHGGKMNVFQRNIFNGAWETEWKSTDESYLSLSGGTLSGDLKMTKSLPRIQMNDTNNSRYGVFEIGADGFVSMGNWKENTDQANLQLRKPADGLEDVLKLTINGDKSYRVFGEHNMGLMGVSIIGTTRHYLGSGLDKNDTSTVIMTFDFPVKFLFMGLRNFTPKGSGELGVVSTEDIYTFKNSAAINIEAMTHNQYNGKAITTKTELVTGQNLCKVVVSDDRKTITIVSTNAAQGFNIAGEYYYYTAIG